MLAEQQQQKSAPAKRVGREPKPGGKDVQCRACLRVFSTHEAGRHFCNICKVPATRPLHIDDIKEIIDVVLGGTVLITPTAINNSLPLQNDDALVAFRNHVKPRDVKDGDLKFWKKEYDEELLEHLPCAKCGVRGACVGFSELDGVRYLDRRCLGCKLCTLCRERPRYMRWQYCLKCYKDSRKNQQVVVEVEEEDVKEEEDEEG